MTTVPLRKARAGSDSYGHEWPEDGAVVEVDYAHALVLMAIPDGGFTVADQAPAEEQTAGEAAAVDGETDPAEEMSEVAPDTEPDASPAPAKRTTRRGPAKS